MIVTQARRSTSALDAIAYAGIFVFGIVMALLGAVMPLLTERLGLSLGDVGTVFLVTNGSMLAASIITGPAIDRFGMRLPLGLGAMLVGVALSSIAVSRSTSGLLLAVSLLGLGGGAVNATANTLIADLHEDAEEKAAALNVLGVFFGFGALLLPFSIGALLSTVGLTNLLFAAGALAVVTGLVANRMRFPPPKLAGGMPFAGVGRFIRMPLVLAFAGLLFFQSGNEFLLGGYFTTFLTRDMGVPVAQSSYVLAAFWASIMVARVFLSRAVLRLGSYRTVLAAALVAAAGAFTVSAASSAPVAIAGMIVTGFALAGIFPTVLGMAGGAFAAHSGTVFGILFTVALTGGMTMPWIAGHLAEAAGLRAVFVMGGVSFLVIAAFNRVVRRSVE